MTLYEINEQIAACVDAETGEIIDLDRLITLNMERDEKLENVVLWVKDLTAEAEAIKAEKQKLAERQKTAENKAERLKTWLTEQLDGQKFSTAKCAVTFRKSKSVNVTDMKKIPLQYLHYTEPTADKKAIKAAIDRGEDIEGAEIVESVSTIIK